MSLAPINIANYNGTIGALTINGSFTQNAVTTNGVNIPNTWGTNWKSKLIAVKAGLGTATIAIVGDSISQGFDGADLTTRTTSDTWVGLLRTGLQALYGDGGSGFISVSMCMQAFPVQAYSVTQTGVFCNASGAGAWATQVGDGPGCLSAYNQNTGTFITWNYVRGTTITIYYVIASTNGSMTVTIDGTVVGTITTTNSTLGIAYTSYTVTAGTHVVTCTNIGGGSSGYISLFGVRGTNATGVIVDNYSLSGSSSVDWNQGLSGKAGQGNPISYSGGPYAGLSNAQCDLFIYALGVNDAHGTNSQSLTVLTYGQNLVNAFEYHKNNSTNFNSPGNADLMYIAPGIGNFQNTNTSYPNYSMMASTARSICDTYGAGWISLGTPFKNSWYNFWNIGGFGTANGATAGQSGTDGVHPSTIGHNLYYQIIFPILKKIT